MDQGHRGPSPQERASTHLQLDNGVADEEPVDLILGELVELQGGEGGVGRSVVGLLEFGLFVGRGLLVVRLFGLCKKNL